MDGPSVKHYAVLFWQIGAYLLVVAVGVVGLWQIHNQAHHACIAVENLKDGQREQAQATIDGDNALLKTHPNGLPGFPRSVILADRAAKQKTVDRYPPRTC